LLVEFYGSNFGCFRDEFRLSLLATEIDPGSDRGIIRVTIDGEDKPLRLLRAAAIYGPNASGKSTIISAASALHYLIRYSHALASDDKLLPYEPYLLDDRKSEPVVLGLRGVVERVVYDYQVSFGASSIQHESLKELSGERRLLFQRDGKSVQGVWTHDDQFRLIAGSYRDNVLLLSLADSLAPQLSRSIVSGFRRLLLQTAALPFSWPGLVQPEGAIERALESEEFHDWLTGRLRAADLGIVEMHVKSLPQEDTGGVDERRPKVERRPRSEITLAHASPDGPVKLPYARESLGTRRLIQLSPVFYDLTRGAGGPCAVFVDELDSSMHPELIRDLIDHFNGAIAPEQVRGQLIFTTHETTLVDAEAKAGVLRRDQVYFTEKAADGAARLYSLAEFKERNNLNIRKRYLEGRYGALPALGPHSE
jgi:hypothetical protein